jgi:predicted DNA-binding transcriptional regulator YafY
MNIPTPGNGVSSTVCICLRVDDDALAAVDRLTVCREKRVVNKESETFVWFTTELSTELFEWVRAMGPKVEVMFPLSLREHMRRSLTQTLHQYRSA